MSLVVTTTSLPNAKWNEGYSQSLQASGGAPPYSWSLISGSLIPGLALDSAGLIYGTPLFSALRGFVVQVTDSLSATGTASLQIISTVMPEPVAGQLYSYQFTQDYARDVLTYYNHFEPAHPDISFYNTYGGGDSWANGPLLPNWTGLSWLMMDMPSGYVHGTAPAHLSPFTLALGMNLVNDGGGSEFAVPPYAPFCYFTLTQAGQAGARYRPIF